MAQALNVSSFFLICILFLTLVQAAPPTVQRRSRARAFIESQCNITLSPDLCVRTLSVYIRNFTSPLTTHMLAQIALKASLAKAESTRAYITSVAKGLNRTNSSGFRAVEECLSHINDGVEQLTNCIKETQSIKDNGTISSNFPWHASNIQTWMSTAVTDATMCINGFSDRAVEGRTRLLIKAKVLNFKEVTSIALALFNKFAVKYGSSHAKVQKVN